MPPTTRRMSRLGLNDQHPSLDFSSTLHPENYHDSAIHDTETSPKPEKPTGVDTPIKSSSSSLSRDGSRTRNEDEQHLNIVNEVTAALHRTDDESASDEEHHVRRNIHGGNRYGNSGVASLDEESEESDEDEPVRYKPVNIKSNTKVVESEDSSGSDVDSEDASRRASRSTSSEEDETMITTNASPTGPAHEPSVLQTTMPVPPLAIISTSPVVPDITLSPPTSPPVAVLSPTSSLLATPTRRLSLAHEPLAYNFREDQLSRPKMTYVCANAQPYWENGVLMTCERVQEKRLGESLKCVSCGSPVLYKARTKRMVQFEAR